MKARWWIWLAYLVGVAVLAFVMGDRSLLLSGPHSVAAYDLPANHQLDAKDLVPIDRANLIGQFLRTPMRAGEPVTAADVAEKQVFTKHRNMMAAIIEVPVSVIDHLQLKEGLSVQICRKAHPFAGPGKVLALACDDGGHCSATVELAKDAHQTIDPDSLVDATLAATAGQNPCQAASP